jgi:hypothetical protein
LVILSKKEQCKASKNRISMLRNPNYLPVYVQKEAA